MLAAHHNSAAAVCAACAAVSAIFAAVLIANCAACFTRAAVPSARFTTKSLAYNATIAAVSSLSASNAPAWATTTAVFAAKPAANPESILTALPALMINSPSFITSQAAKNAVTDPTAISKFSCDFVSQLTTADNAVVNASNTGFATVSQAVLRPSHRPSTSFFSLSNHGCNSSSNPWTRCLI